MTLIARCLERALSRSKFVCGLISSVSSLASVIDEQKKTIDSLMRTVYLHQEAMREILTRQALMMRDAHDSLSDIALPDSKKTKETKPN